MGYKKLNQISYLVTGRVQNTYKQLTQKPTSCDSTHTQGTQLPASTNYNHNACHPVCMQAHIELYILWQIMTQTTLILIHNVMYIQELATD